MDNFICGGYIFTSNFDSGNLHKVELVKWNEDILPSNHAVGIEFNLWTKPDCAGTEYENLNRSWFFFSVQGGQPNTICKFNVVNLNKQAKLFSQGMHPVIRVGETGKWERTKDIPIYDLVDGEFMLSFFHKPQANVNEKFYYAFTFPFTYTELQHKLTNYDLTYRKTPTELDYIVRRLNNIDRNANIESAREQQNEEQVTECSNENSIVALEQSSMSDIENEIYYHRELLINSVEGRRIDLLTITSFANITPEREYRFNDLFPERQTPRCHTFKGKKVIFISSRVHPGETPASFVLNGFLKVILDKKNKYSSLLRKLYVFKIVPFLNPDGVFNGCYRSDTLGQNLNRVYLAPRIDTQPSIYAVRKLIRYYHDDKVLDEMLATDEDIENSPNGISPTDSDNMNNNAMAVASETPVDSIESPETEATSCEQVNIVIEDLSSQTSSNESTPSSTRCPSTEIESSGTGDTSTPMADAMPLNLPLEIEDVIKLEKCEKPLVAEPTVFCDKFMVELKPSISTIVAPLMPLQKNILNANASGLLRNTPRVQKMTLKPHTDGIDLNLLNVHRNIYGDPNSSPSTSCSSNVSARTVDDKKRDSARSLLGSATSKKSVLGTLPLSSRNPFNKVPRRIRPASNTNNNNINISADFLEKHSATDRKSNIIDSDNSNMFLYIDLHGHASKKGIFMYGNHLPNTAEAVECMLLPRLMSMNCHHFHFDACVFSERNMYHKGKRDGLSKEGSGRVAMYKAIGLIKCYTLEGNYNTGKYVNVLPPRGKETTSKKINQTPPKYTPAIYEEVGRALAPSILDLTDANPMTRLRNSDFRSLQGLRTYLRNEIERSAAASRNSTAMPKVALGQVKSRYLTNTNACCSQLTTDISKENKGRITTNTKLPISSYSKKEKPPSTLLLTRKKGKVLCDVIPTSSSSVPLTAKFNDLTQTQPIPNKRPKVVLSKKLPVNDDKLQETPVCDPCVDDELKIASTLVDSNSLTFIETSIPSTFDPDMPCCSHQAFSQALPSSASSTSAGLSFPKKLKKITRKIAPPTSATPSMAHKQVKKPLNALKLCNSIASVGTSTSSNSSMSNSSTTVGPSSLIRTTRRSSLSRDGRKLKKKKSLRAEATLKRKKSRVF